MQSQTKPVFRMFKEMSYARHKNKLATIESERPQLRASCEIEDMHRLRSLSLSYHHNAQEDSINQRNQQLLKRLLTISKRKQSEYAQAPLPPKMASFNNPARRKRQRIITEMNHQMAQRLLTKQSGLDHRTMRRSMDDYERIKQTIANNKRALGRNTLPQLQLSRTRVREEESLRPQHSQSRQRNPEQSDSEERFPASLQL